MEFMFGGRSVATAGVSLLLLKGMCTDDNFTRAKEAPVMIRDRMFGECFAYQSLSIFLPRT